MIDFSDLDTDLNEAVTKEQLKKEEIQKNAHIVNGGEATFDCPACNGTGRVMIGYTFRRPANCFKCKATGKVSKRVVAAAKAKITREQNLENKRNDFIENNTAAWEFICRNAEWSDFYRSMQDSVNTYGGLSEKQLDAVVRGMAKAAERAEQKNAEKEAKGGAVDVSAIEKLFDTARESGLKRLGFRTMEIDISAAKETSRNPGALYVKHNGEYVGKIINSKFVATWAAKEDTLEKILEVAADPLGMAVQYGKQTGNCSCCGRELTDPSSVEAGIGPICATKWGF